MGAKEGYSTEPIEGYNETKHGAVKTINIAKCKLECVGSDAFNFTGARNVTDIDIRSNSFTALPEHLLKNMPSLRNFRGDQLSKLTSLPPAMFRGHSQLEVLSLTSCPSLDSTGGEGLPSSLLKGLSSLKALSFSYSTFKKLPDLDDLKVQCARFTFCLLSIDYRSAITVAPFLSLVRRGIF